LHKVKNILDMLHNFHCSVTHNEKYTIEDTPKKRTFESIWMSATIQIRRNLNLQAHHRIPVDISRIINTAKRVMQVALDIMDTLCLINIDTEYPIRVQLYKFLLKATQFHCPMFHNASEVFIEHRPALEKKFATLHYNLAKLIIKHPDMPALQPSPSF